MLFAGGVSATPGNAIDYVGMGLLAGGLCGIVLYASLGGTTYPWFSGPMIPLLAAAGDGRRPEPRGQLHGAA